MNIVEASFQELFGIVCWNVNWDKNLNLRIQFGQPSLSIREPKEVKTSYGELRDLFRRRQVSLQGEYFFWVLYGYWKLVIKDFHEVTSTSSYKQMSMALARLNGQKLISATVNPKTAATELAFDLGAILSVRRMSSQSDGDIWSFYKPDGFVISVKADGKYHDDLGDTKPEQIVWQPIAQ